MHCTYGCCLLWIAGAILCGQVAHAENLELELVRRVPVAEGSERFHRLKTVEQWEPTRTAVIVCDMWDSHHSVNAVRRATELAPRIDAFCKALRQRGATIVHAPSSCMATYQKHPARQRAREVPPADDFPPDIGSWCDQIPSEEQAAYPVDQSAGGEDDDLREHELWAARLKALGRDPRQPWQAQIDSIEIDPQQDYISDSGHEIWSLLESRDIDQVMLVGVHTNMCVLGRPFGLRRLSAAGKRVVLVRDLTDTMIDPRAWPYANHFSGTDLIVKHIERFVCPTITSDQVLGGDAFRFASDGRPTLLIVVAEQEYDTATSLPHFAAKHLSTHFRVRYAWADVQDRNRIVGLEQLAEADAVLISVRRRALPAEDVERLQDFVAQAKPVIGIRTASHAFSLRGEQPPTGAAVWESFDADVFGGNYTNHYGNDLKSTVAVPSAGAIAEHPVLSATHAGAIQPGGSLYKTAPLAPGTLELLSGEVEGGEPQPLAWTFVRGDSGRSFYTSLGHVDDFAQPEFEALLAAGIHWACGLEPKSLAQVKLQNERYAAGRGKQR